MRGRILLTAATPAMQALAAELRGAGLDVVEVPVVSLAAPEDPRPFAEALRGLASYDWIAFTSGNAVRAVGQALAPVGGGLPAALRVASVGPSTTRAFEETFPGRTVEVQPASDHHADGLADVLAGMGMAGQRVLLPLSDRARDVLPRRLREMGARVDPVVAYRTAVGADLTRVQLATGVDLAVFASPSAVEGLTAAAGPEAAGIPAVVIGPTTAAAAQEAGLRVVGVASPSTLEGLKEAILAHLSARRP